MASIDFSVRSLESEWMDEVTPEPQVLRKTLDELATINRFLGGYSTSLSGIASLLPDTSEISVLDVGGGGGDTARKIAEWAARRGVTANIEAIDLSPEAIQNAKFKNGNDSRLNFKVKNFFEMDETSQYDIVHASLVLHHFNDEELVPALLKMEQLSRLGVVINDLQRHPMAYVAIRNLVRFFSASCFIKHDAPLSVLRAFTRAELEALLQAAGFDGYSLRRRWAFRWLVVIPKQHGTV